MKTKAKTTYTNSQKATTAEPQEQGRTHERLGLDYDLPASCAIAAERLEHGIEALDQALGDALDFFLWANTASQRQSLPIEAKLEALSLILWQDAPGDQAKLVSEVTSAAYAIKDWAWLRLKILLGRRAVSPELLLAHADSMLFAAEWIVTGMRREFPESKRPASGSSASPAVVPNWPGAYGSAPNWRRRGKQAHRRTPVW